MTLTEGSVKRNQAIVYENLFGDLGLAPTRFKFNVGDRVRIVKKKKAFEKGYTPRWTEEVFTTSKHTYIWSCVCIVVHTSYGLVSQAHNSLYWCDVNAYQTSLVI